MSAQEGNVEFAGLYGDDDLSQPFPMDRRRFVKVMGGGIAILFTLGDHILFAQQGRGQNRPTDPNAYLRIGEDGRVTVFTGKIEMGQGIHTSLGQMAAEELRVSHESIDMVMGDTDLCPWDTLTVGSRTTRGTGPVLRAAAAEAREIMIDLAAEHLGASRGRLNVEEGVVFVTDSKDQSVSYAELARGKAIARTLDREAVLRSVSQFTVMGKPTKRVDAIDKATGKALFSGDIRLPGMLYARLLRPPSLAGEMTRVDTSAAEAMDGVTVVREEGLVAVLHENPEMSERALQAVETEFHVPESNLDNETIFDHLVSVAPEPEVRDVRGSLAEGERIASQLFEETYLDGYVAHAPMEPHTAVATLEDSKLTVWASTQGPFSLKDSLVREFGLAPEQVRVITPFVGGGFGGKTSNPQAIEAARLTRATGRPVMVAWTRAEEFLYDRFRPAAVIRIRSGIDDVGKICLWDYNLYFTNARGSEMIYDAPHSVIKVSGGGWRGVPGGHPLFTGAWRAPGASTNVFGKESQIDVMAAAAGIDPLKFRLDNTSDPRARSVLTAVAERFGYEPASTPSGRGIGMACGLDSETYVAHIVQVDVDRSSGKVRVKRVVCAQDMGFVVNPEGALMQAEGCIMMGLGYALTEDVRFRGGEVLDRNFDTYELPRFSWLPEIDVVLVKNDDLPQKGGGEPAIICMGGAIANAIFDLTGARLFQLPMNPESVRRALARF
jgi:isoquinoline 1-oxidoreductase